MKKRFSVIFILAAALPLASAVGTTSVCKWKDGKAAAFTLGADDGCSSQLDNMVPALKSRGLVATFWIIGKKDYFIARIAAWRTTVRNDGNDFANHAMTAATVSDFAAADSEIGGCARLIWSLNPAQGKLQLFHPGGGVIWNITSQQKTELLSKYNVYPYWDEAGRGDGIHDGAYTDHDAATLKGYLDNAIRDGDWHFTIFHGVGGDWITQNVPAFTELLDYMVTKKSTVWFPTCTQAHKYKKERQSAQVTVIEATTTRIRVNLTSSTDTALYNYPLTLKTALPAGWDSCRVTQGAASTVFPVRSDTVMYYALPGKGEITLVKNQPTEVRTPATTRSDASGRSAVRVRIDMQRASVMVQHTGINTNRHADRLFSLSGTQIINER